jgi:hypothetical protein
MTSRPPAREDRGARETYEIRVEGDVSVSAREALAAHIDGLRVAREPVASVLSGPVEDQAALYGLLDRLHALGLVVVEVRRVGGVADEDAPAADVPGARLPAPDGTVEEGA